MGIRTAPTLRQRVVWLMAAAFLALYAAAALVGSVAPFYGGLGYNPEFDGLFMPMGLFAAYGSLYCFRRAFPHIPWVGEPSLNQGCLFSWLGFAVLGIVFTTLGAIRGNRSFDPATMAIFWGVVLMPLALFWVVRRAAALVRKR